jgi:hypothetical protein
VSVGITDSRIVKIRWIDTMEGGRYSLSGGHAICWVANYVRREELKSISGEKVRPRTVGGCRGRGMAAGTHHAGAFYNNPHGGAIPCTRSGD